MKNALTMIPAYGRDYKSAAEVEKDFRANKDFIIADVSNRWDGRAVNRQSLLEAGIPAARIRYKRKTRVVILEANLT